MNIEKQIFESIKCTGKYKTGEAWVTLQMRSFDLTLICENRSNEFMHLNIQKFANFLQTFYRCLNSLSELRKHYFRYLPFGNVVVQGCEHHPARPRLIVSASFGPSFLVRSIYAEDKRPRLHFQFRACQKRAAHGILVCKKNKGNSVRFKEKDFVRL